jgi:2'-5' RNA ligase
MRCFIAIDVPEDIKNSISILIKGINHRAKGIKWVPPEKIHLTLKFLGEIKEERIKEIKDRLDSISSNHRDFDISVSKIGGFPSLKNPNVLWIGIDYSEDLKRLYEDVEDAMFDLGFEKENRKFFPHLTIARMKDKRDIDPIIKSLIAFKDKFFGYLKVEEILLMKSVLRPSGAEYSKIEAFKLLKE